MPEDTTDHYEAPFLLIGRKGEAIAFDDLASLASFARRGGLLLGLKHSFGPVDPSVPCIERRRIADTLRDACFRMGNAAATYGHVRIVGDWIIRDLNGSAVPPAVAFEALRVGQTNRWWGAKRAKAVRQAMAAGCPIPGTGRRRWYSNSMRDPKTLTELRANASLGADERDLGDEDMPIRISGRRRDVPTSWDDILITRERGWKAHRRTRWRATD